MTFTHWTGCVKELTTTVSCCCSGNKVLFAITQHTSDWKILESSNLMILQISCSDKMQCIKTINQCFGGLWENNYSRAIISRTATEEVHKGWNLLPPISRWNRWFTVMEWQTVPLPTLAPPHPSPRLIPSHWLLRNWLMLSLTSLTSSHLNWTWLLPRHLLWRFTSFGWSFHFVSSNLMGPHAVC